MGDLSVPCAQWFRSANNVFEHRVAIDLFSQRQIFVPRSLFRPDAVINVGARCIPSSNLSALVSKRIVLRSEEHTSELQSRRDLVCRLLLEKKKNKKKTKQ